MMVKMLDMYETSFLSGANAGYIEAQYEAYQQDPHSVATEWQQFFSVLPGEATSVNHHELRQRLVALMQANQPRVNVSASGGDNSMQIQAYINHIRQYGHGAANLDPLGLYQPTPLSQLMSDDYALNPNDPVPKPWQLGGCQVVSELQEYLASMYCQHVGVEFSQVSHHAERQWLYDNYEHMFSPDNPLPSAEQKAILQWLTAADGIEKFLGQKHPGEKRFSLEGGDALIPMLKHLVQLSPKNGIQRINFGMAHRGRLNVLINIMGRSAADVSQEFEGKKEVGMTSGDVKYHMGFSSDILSEQGDVHLSLACNPSHLEVISPVVLGGTRAAQDRVADPQTILPILIHGDAAFAGQGIVMETFALSNTRGYKVGGAIHLVINNQVGFTTSDARDARSSRYCTDVAKMIEAPVLHVNGDDPEATYRCMALALAYRQKFKKDIVIDLVCYRRHGHQEVDEPSGTQPLMYQRIQKKPSLREIYGEHLVKTNIISKDTINQMKKSYRQLLDDKQPVVDHLSLESANQTDWENYLDQCWTASAETGCDLTDLQAWAQQLSVVPEQFVLQKQVGQMMSQRQSMAAGQASIDWGFAETLAYASLLSAGCSVRMTGQDVRRGTFFHRHAVLHNNQTDEIYMPLQSFARDSHFSVYDSILSEAGVLGFEYGYASNCPHDLVIWEAQFGDFVNGAQVVIDQFISSAWQKWGRLCGLVMLLPHGYEGQGPEHSSARLERFLHLSAQDNIQVCMPSNASQIFHLLRRQLLREYRRPLIVMTPKRLLRLEEAKASFTDLAKGQFNLVIDATNKHPDQVKRIIFCSGKVYYDLMQHEAANDSVAVIRIEQLYPFPTDQLSAVLSRYSHYQRVVWCQEEPRNQGAWRYIRYHLQQVLPERMHLKYSGRDEAASPAVGYRSLHMKQQQALVEDALLGTD